jgi:hypothetical protein
VTLPFTLKSISRQKEELWKFKYFTMQKHNLHKKKKKKKKSAKETKMLADIINSIITNLKFQHKPKLSSFEKKSLYKQ